MTWMRALIDQDYYDSVVSRLSWLDGCVYRDSYPEIREGIRAMQAYSLCVNGVAKMHKKFPKHFSWFSWE